MPGISLPGLYRGIVYDNRDPEHRGRCRVTVPALFGATPTNWAWASFPPGVGFSGGTYGGGVYGGNGNGCVPTIGTGVWIMFEAGSPNHPVWIGVF